MSQWTVDVASEGAPFDPALERSIEAAIRTVFEAEDAEAAEISVALLPNESIRAIHRDYLGDDTPTDVITFPLREPGRPLIGDVYIGVEYAGEQARTAGVSFEEEIVRLAVHAALHLLGWEHPESDDRFASPMYLRQEELVKGILDAGR